MSPSEFNTELPPAIESKARAIFDDHRLRIYVDTDRMFAFLLTVQWLGGIIAAVVVSPRTWAGSIPSTHIHVWSALVCGGVLSSLPIWLAIRSPGRPATRYVIAVAQMLWSALLIHLTGGRIETHFHVFGSLAFLAFYRDWKVLVPATIVIAVDHAVRGIVWPQSVYGVLTASPWRSVEHAAWVIFEDIFLVRSCRMSVSEMKEISVHRARLERLNRQFESMVEQRTDELRASLSWKASLLESAAEGIITIDERGSILDCNLAAERLFAYEHSELAGVNVTVLMPAPYAQHHDDHLQTYLQTGKKNIIGTRREVTGLRKDGTTLPLDLSISEVRHQDRVNFTGIVRDLTQQKQRERDLDAANKKLQEISRAAGMADIASGVIHNVGNVLNSVNVSSTLVADKIRNSRLPDLIKVSQLLDANATRLGSFVTEDDKGKRIPEFLSKLARHLTSEQRDIESEIRELSNKIDHIKSIVNTQQSYTGVVGVQERVDLVEVLDDVLKMSEASFRRHEIDVAREFGKLPVFAIDKHKLLQVLVNLVRNAKHALRDGRVRDKKLTVRALMLNENRCRIEVQDNGVGICKESYPKLFSLGFTTKKNGHGFGLHTSSVAVQSMGGTLSAHSDGSQKGAVFTLELPVSQDLVTT